MSGIDSESFGQQFQARVIERGCATSEQDFVGCTDTELRQIEAAHEVCLPHVYRSWARINGRKAGEFAMQGGMYPDVLRAKTHGCITLQRSRIDKPLELKDIFIFDAFEEELRFIDLQSGGDPKVFMFHLDWATPVLLGPFTETLLSWVDELADSFP